MTRRLLMLGTAALTLVAVTAARSPSQAPAPARKPADPRSITFRGDRFKPLTYDEMTPAQKRLLENVLATPRGGAAEGPFNVLLRSPEMGDDGQRFGANRFATQVPRRLWELAILVTARHWTSQFEWYAHERGALNAGLSPAICNAIKEGQRPTSMQPDEEAVYNVSTELLETKQVSDRTFNTIKATLGERGLVDLIGVLGWYGTVSMLLNVDRYPLPAGVPPVLKPLK